MSGPLAGLRIVEIGGMGPGPFCGMVLADLGAEVIRIDRVESAGQRFDHPILHRGRRSIALDLKDPAGVDAVLRLVDAADACFEGFRPGVAERLGLGPDVCRARNPRLVYGRMTGFGQFGPYAEEPGHDINYIAVGGALGAIAAPGGADPVLPLNLVGDFGGGGMLLAVGILSAVLHARSTGEGQVVDAAMTDGTALLMAMAYGLLPSGRWRDELGTNVANGVSPFYRTYRCADGRHLAVGCVEPQFYAAMLATVGLSEDPLFAEQHAAGSWPQMCARLEQEFAQHDREYWVREFAGKGACVSPVLSLAEAVADPHHVARETFLLDARGQAEPAPAPRFSATPNDRPSPAPVVGADTDTVLASIGLDVDDLRAHGVVR